jgi:hypothetical protein
MFKQRCLAVLAVAVGPVLAVACTTAETRMTDVYRERTYTGGPKTNVLVVGGRMTAGHRRLVEDGFVAGLVVHGIHAAPSYALFPGQIPSRDEVRSAIHDAGFDGVLVSTYRRIKEEQSLEPDDWGSYVDWFYVGTGTTVSDQTVVFVTSLVDPHTEQVLWSARTETLNPSSGDNFVASLTKRIVPALTTAGLIPPLAPAVSQGKPSRASARASW